MGKQSRLLIGLEQNGHKMFRVTENRHTTFFGLLKTIYLYRSKFTCFGKDPLIHVYDGTYVDPAITKTMSKAGSIRKYVKEEYTNLQNTFGFEVSNIFCVSIERCSNSLMQSGFNFKTIVVTWSETLNTRVNKGK